MNSGPRSRWGNAPWRSSTRAPPRHARCNAQRSPTRWTYRSSSRSFRPSVVAATRPSMALGLELVHLMWADAGDRQLVRIDRVGDRADLVERDGVERVDRPIRVDVLPVDDGLAGGVARHRVGVLEREDATAGGIGARPRDLLLGRAVGLQLGDDLAHPRVGLVELGGLQPRAELQHREVAEHVVDGVDGVAEPALL